MNQILQIESPKGFEITDVTVDEKFWDYGKLKMRRGESCTLTVNVAPFPKFESPKIENWAQYMNVLIPDNYVPCTISITDTVQVTIKPWPGLPSMEFKAIIRVSDGYNPANGSFVFKFPVKYT